MNGRDFPQQIHFILRDISIDHISILILSAYLFVLIFEAALKL